jgi:hypothetical protein
MSLVATKRPLLERVAKATGSVEIVPRKPLALVDRRLYNYLLANAYQELGKATRHTVRLSEVGSTESYRGHLRAEVRPLLSGQHPAAGPIRPRLGSAAGSGAGVSRRPGRSGDRRVP